MYVFFLLTGVLLIAHAAYSSYEWVSLNKILGSAPEQRLPRDVTIETLLALLLVLFGAVGRLVRNLRPAHIADDNVERTMNSEEPFGYLETRPNFQDLIARRTKYLDWRTKQGTEAKA